MTELVVGARTYNLRFKNDSIEAAERQMGGESWERSISERGNTRLKVYLWAAMRGQTRGKSGVGTIPLGEIGDIMDKAVGQGMSYADLWDKVMSALIDSGWLKAPDVEEDHETNRPTSAPARGHIPSEAETG